MSKISPCLWFDGKAEEAANFYISVFKDGSLDMVSRYAEDHGSPAPFKGGDVLLVEFTLFGQTYQGLNGGAQFQFSEAISLSVGCADQAELDGYFDALTADGGVPGPCGWVTDKYGLSWQLVPAAMVAMYKSQDKAAIERMMGVMMTMEKLDIAALQAAFDGRMAKGDVG